MPTSTAPPPRPMNSRRFMASEPARSGRCSHGRPFQILAQRGRSLIVRQERGHMAADEKPEFHRATKLASRNCLCCRKLSDMSIRGNVVRDAASWSKGRDFESGTMAEEAWGRGDQDPADDTYDTRDRQPCDPRSSAGNDGRVRSACRGTCRQRFGDRLDNDEQTNGTPEEPGSLIVWSRWRSTVRRGGLPAGRRVKRATHGAGRSDWQMTVSGADDTSECRRGNRDDAFRQQARLLVIVDDES